MIDGESYLAWANDALNISFAKKIVIKDMPGGERGIYCDEDIEPNSAIFSIPFSSLLSIKSAAGTPFEDISDWREDDLLAILLLYEKYHKRESSFWHPHIQCIPKEYHSIINFTDDELEMIKGSNLYMTTIAWKSQIRNDFMSLSALLQAHAPTDDFFWFTHDNYVWALCTIWSRFVTIEKDGRLYRSMVPCFDMLNHHPHSRVGHIFQDGKVILLTQQSHRAGDELCLHYGSQSNTKLMMLYGFCIPPSVGNPEDSVDLWASMSPAAPHYDLKAQLLASWDIYPDKRPFQLTLCTDTTCGVPKDLVVCLRVQYGDAGGELSPQDFSAAREGPLSEATEALVASLLVSALRGMLDSYETTLAEDEERLTAMGLLTEGRAGAASDQVTVVDFVPPSDREKNAVIMRHAEKVILSSVIEWVETHSTNIGGC